MPLIKVGLLVKYFENIFSKKIRPFFNTENDFENQNFEIFEEVVDNFWKSDDDMIYWNCIVYCFMAKYLDFVL